VNRLLPSNEHAVDRALRLVLGLGLLSLAFWGPKTLWGLAGLIPIVTGMIGSCPIYSIVGISTRSGK
jgi:hypothetical protein